VLDRNVEIVLKYKVGIKRKGWLADNSTWITFLQKFCVGSLQLRLREIFNLCRQYKCIEWECKDVIWYKQWEWVLLHSYEHCITREHKSWH